jgi:hypothetical protein
MENIKIQLEHHNFFAEKLKGHTVGKYQHYLHGSGLLGSEKQWL